VASCAKEALLKAKEKNSSEKVIIFTHTGYTPPPSKKAITKF
jgi:hypothetical protein